MFHFCSYQLVYLLDWAGSSTYRKKALQRCHTIHTRLTEMMKREFVEWSERLDQDFSYAVQCARPKFVICRHFVRPDWIQPNLDRYYS